MRMFKIITLLIFTFYVPSVGASDSRTARAFQAHVQLEYFEGALFDFVSHVGRLPTTSEGLAALVQNPSSVPNWKGPYLNPNHLPKDPWGENYIYKYREETYGKNFIIYSKGKNRIDESGVGDDFTIYTDPMRYGKNDWGTIKLLLYMDFPVFLFIVALLFLIRKFKKKTAQHLH